MTNLEKAAVRVMMLTDRSPEAIQAVIDFTHKMRDLLGGDKSVTMDSEDYRWITINNAPVKVNENGDLTGEVGEKIRMDAERQKILDGTYPSKIRQDLQDGHVKGTRQFNKKLSKAQGKSPYYEPSILYPNEDAQKLVDRHKGTGYVYMHPTSGDYPREDVELNRVIGKWWDVSIGGYSDTNTFTIVYSSKGTHIFPVKPKK